MGYYLQGRLFPLPKTGIYMNSEHKQSKFIYGNKNDDAEDEDDEGTKSISFVQQIWNIF